MREQIMNANVWYVYQHIYVTAKQGELRASRSKQNKLCLWELFAYQLLYLSEQCFLWLIVLHSYPFYEV